MPRPRTPRIIALLALAAAGASLRAQDWQDKVQEALAYSDARGAARAQLRGEFCADLYFGNQYSPGLVVTDRDFLVAPKVTLYADAQLGDTLYGFVQARLDRGFDPADARAEFRMDEYALRYTPVDARLGIQAGKFATVLGNWVARHDAWDNPFVGAPLPYENLTHIYDGRAVRTVSDLEAGEEIADYDYNPIVWGPAYATGAAVAGLLGKFDYAAEIKNAGPSSRPDAWGLDAQEFAHPALAARLGFRPDMRFRIGLSAGDSVYLREEAAATLAPGRGLGDYRQRLIGQDFSFEWRRLQIWAEAMETRLEIPGLGHADSIAAYVETRYKFTARFFGALRVNGQTFNTLKDAGGEAKWGEDRGRIDLGVTYRFTTQSQLKFQVSGNRAWSGEDHQLKPTGAAQFLLRF